jgi:hypothetical protein
LERMFLISVFSLVSLGMIGLGMWGLVRCLLAIVRGIKSKSWTIVEGTINISRLSEWWDADSGGARLGPIEYLAYIEYSYEFNRVKHKSNRISIGDEFRRFGSKERAEEIRAKYPSGGKVKVYCNPKRPQLSILETGFKPKSFIFLVMSICITGAGTFVFFFLILPGILSH